MSRPLRIEEPGLWHHVMNRGLERRAIFVDETDREGFLGLLAEVGPRWQVWCHAACLLENHYHLLLHDEGGNLGRALRHVDGVHTQRFNRRHERDGPLMRGRYRSRLVQEEGYLFEVVRYIHMNPVSAGLVRKAGEYQWSSHRHYSQRKVPEWLRRDVVCDRFGRGRAGWVRFDEFVHARIPEKIHSVLDDRRWKPVVGDERFQDTWKERVRTREVGREREVVEARRLTAVSVKEIVQTACEVFGMEEDALVSGRRGCTNLPRHLTMLACRQYTAVDNREIGLRFKVSAATVSSAVRRIRAQLGTDRKAMKLQRRLEKALGNKSQDAT